ncbi:MOSC N-terminal beta barrel domain-containing protein [Geopyxis carbonaria]|nr:MOSC N-terminal beta barrel domain-containing protein [Geopyxis carbonaria]
MMDFELPFYVLSAVPVLVPGLIAFAVWLRLSLTPPAEPAGEKLGVQRSNIADELKYTHEEGRAWTVKSLWVYPIKSCAGIEVDEVSVVPTGLENDRQFMLAEWKQDQKTGEMKWAMMTMRQYPKMALVTPQIYLDRKAETGGTLLVSFPSSRSGLFAKPRTFSVPLNASEKHMSQYPLETAGIWKDTANIGHNMSSLIPHDLAALGAFLGAKGQIALFRVCNAKPREVFRCAPPAEALGYQAVVGFADAYPLHLLNIASVRDLAQKVEGKIPDLGCRRFRANIIVSGPKAFDEDDWKVLTLGQNTYHAACRTTRCLLPNVNPATGVKHAQEPDQTMRAYRRIDAGTKGKACMGMQLVPAAEMGMLRVGDGVAVGERGEHYNI